MTTPMLFQPITIRGLTLANRIVIAPMCQYSADEGLANDWQMVHLGKFAIGRAGGILTEAAAVLPEGRITHGDLGIWSDAHAEALRPIVRFLQGQGSAAGVQLGHAGRKASMQRPWYGNGPLGPEDAARGDKPWPIMGPTEAPVDAGWLKPQAMTEADIAKVIDAFAAAAKRADAVGFDFAEVHGAHGYLTQTFLSPLSNTRTDRWGGDLAGRMRFALEVAKAVRAAWPAEKPLFFRVSSVDGIEGGWEIEDSVALAKELKTLGVDVIDCSSGGNNPKGATAAGLMRGLGFQTPFSERIRNEAGILTQAVGLILDGPQGEASLQEGKADLIAIGREALFDPHWPLHAARALGLEDYERWPKQYGWWLDKREPSIRRIREGA
jgi:2,4-dienoyl-CoA reductase-like NADH-dependent reductase (Old Yellow Enzyme family)